MNLNHLVAKEIVYTAKTGAITGKVMGVMNTIEGRHLVLLRGKGGIEYLCDIHHVHLVEELRQL